MKQTPQLTIAAGVLTLALSALPLHAATNVIFEDDFGTSPTPGTINDFGYYTQANSGGMWGILTSDSGTTMDANFLRNGGSSANTNSIKQWMDAPITLSGVGDSLVVSFDIDSRGPFLEGSALNLQIALYNSSYEITANQISGANPFVGNVSGYGYFQTMDGGNVYRLTDYDTTADLGGSPDSITAPAELYDQTVHTVSFHITKEETGATFALYDGTNLLYSHTDTTASSFTFNTLRLRNPGVGTGGVYLDNISVTHTTGSTIPEPSVAGVLAGIATLGFVAGRRRRR